MCVCVCFKKREKEHLYVHLAPFDCLKLKLFFFVWAKQNRGASV